MYYLHFFATILSIHATSWGEPMDLLLAAVDRADGLPEVVDSSSTVMTPGSGSSAVDKLDASGGATRGTRMSPRSIIKNFVKSMHGLPAEELVGPLRDRLAQAGFRIGRDVLLMDIHKLLHPTAGDLRDKPEQEYLLKELYWMSPRRTARKAHEALVSNFGPAAVTLNQVKNWWYHANRRNRLPSQWL